MPHTLLRATAMRVYELGWVKYLLFDGLCLNITLLNPVQKHSTLESPGVIF